MFQGYLSNLDELIEELLYGALPEPGTSYESEYNQEAFQLRSRGDQAQLSAEVILHMFLRKRHDTSSLPILLSELQVLSPSLKCTLGFNLVLHPMQLFIRSL